MLEIVNAILDMTGSDGKSDRFDPEKQVEKMFQLMDTVSEIIIIWAVIYNLPFQDGNGELSREEFLQGASQDNSFFAAALFWSIICQILICCTFHFYILIDVVG